MFLGEWNFHEPKISFASPARRKTARHHGSPFQILLVHSPWFFIEPPNSLHVGYCFLSLFQITLHGISWTKSKCYETPTLFNKISILMISLCPVCHNNHHSFWDCTFVLSLKHRNITMFVNKCKCCNHHIFEIVFRCIQYIEIRVVFFVGFATENANLPRNFPEKKPTGWWLLRHLAHPKAAAPYGETWPPFSEVRWRWEWNQWIFSMDWFKGKFTGNHRFSH